MPHFRFMPVSMMLLSMMTFCYPRSTHTSSLPSLPEDGCHRHCTIPHHVLHILPRPRQINDGVEPGVTGRLSQKDHFFFDNRLAPGSASHITARRGFQVTRKYLPYLA